MRAGGGSFPELHTVRAKRMERVLPTTGILEPLEVKPSTMAVALYGLHMHVCTLTLPMHTNTHANLYMCLNMTVVWP